MTIIMALFGSLCATTILIQGQPFEIRYNDHRGQRYCEIGEFDITALESTIWTSFFQHDCPQEIWDDIKLELDTNDRFNAVAIRYVVRDSTIMYFDSSPLQIEEFFGLNDPVNNAAPFIRQFENPVDPDAELPQLFTPYPVSFPVLHGWNKHSTIFLLKDPSHNYYILANTETEDVDGLEITLPAQYVDQNLLPDGWKLEIRKAKDYIFNTNNSTKMVTILDGLGNSYFLLSTDTCSSCDRKLIKSSSCTCSADSSSD